MNNRNLTPIEQFALQNINDAIKRGSKHLLKDAYGNIFDEMGIFPDQNGMHFRESYNRLFLTSDIKFLMAVIDEITIFNYYLVQNNYITITNCNLPNVNQQILNSLFPIFKNEDSTLSQCITCFYNGETEAVYNPITFNEIMAPSKITPIEWIPFSILQRFFDEKKIIIKNLFDDFFYRFDVNYDPTGKLIFNETQYKTISNFEKNVSPYIIEEIANYILNLSSKDFFSLSCTICDPSYPANRYGTILNTEEVSITIDSKNKINKVMSCEATINLSNLQKYIDYILS